MSFHILKSSARAANKVPLRSVSTTSVCKQQEVVTLSQTQKDKFYPKIGKFNTCMERFDLLQIR